MNTKILSKIYFYVVYFTVNACSYVCVIVNQCNIDVLNGGLFFFFTTEHNNLGESV